MTTTDISDDPAPESSGYSPKPDLWRPVPEKPTPVWGMALLILIAILSLPFIALAFEPYLLAEPIGQVEVTIVEVAGGAPADDMPASFHYFVKLADGSRLPFSAEHIHRPGEKLLVTASRGRLSGRLRLDAPYRVSVSP